MEDNRSLQSRAQRYIEIAVKHPSNRGVCIPIDEMFDYVSGEQMYRSYYTFDADLPEHLNNFKTIKNYKGKYYIDRIILDIDRHENSDSYVLERTRDLVEKMLGEMDIPTAYILPWFSGNGYHVQIPDIFGFEASRYLPATVKETMTRYFPESDNIFDGARLIRVGYTKNDKTGLYKIPLQIDELMQLSWQEIHKMAETNNRSDTVFKKDFTDAITMFDPIYPTKSKNEDYGSSKTSQVEVSSIAPCVQKMYNEGPVTGNRHTNMLRMISYYRRHGIPQAAAKSILFDWAPDMNKGEIHSLSGSAYAGGYRYGCHDKIMDKYCDPKCIYYPSKTKGNDPLIAVLSAADMEKRYVARIRANLHEHGFNLRDIYPSINKDYWFLPNELNIIMGDTGLGKTSLMQNIVLKTRLRTLWLSLELDEFLMYRRFAQIVKSKTSKEVDDHYMESSNSWSKDLEFIKCITLPPTIESVKHLIAEIDPMILVIDTIDGIKSNQYVNDSMVKIDMIIQGLREIVASQNIMVFGVSHITKSGSQNGVLNVHSAKHSSSIAQKADKVLAIEGMRDEQIRTFKSLKSRDAENFSIQLEYIPEYFQFKEVQSLA